MSGQLSGRELVSFIKERQAHQVRALKQHDHIRPKLAIIQTKLDAVTDLYTKLKQHYGEDVGIAVEIHKVGQSGVERLIERLIERLNMDPTVHGILIQLPLPDPSATDKVVNQVNPAKDVDGLAKRSEWDATTAMAINWLLAGYNIDLTGKQIAIVGRGRLVGAPLTKMWRQSGLNVTPLDIRCPSLEKMLIDKDVVVTATGVPGLIKSEMLKGGAVVVDAGTADLDGRVVGDVDPLVRERSDITITPRKGGVGPLTIACLMDNVIRAARRSLKHS